MRLVQFAILALLICLPLSGFSTCFGDETQAVPIRAADLPLKKAKWTFILYTALDEHGEQGGTFETMKLQQVGSGKDLHIVTQFDRADSDDITYGNWTDARRFYIQKSQNRSSGGDFKAIMGDGITNLCNANPDLCQSGSPMVNLNETDNVIYDPTDKNDFTGPANYKTWYKRITSGDQKFIDEFALDFFYSEFRPMPKGFAPVGAAATSIMSAGEPNTGSPEPFKEFVIWAIENFPAEHYMVAVQGHGAGMFGMGMDLSTCQLDYFDLGEMHDALKEITTTTGIGKFDLFIWHACIMDIVSSMTILEPFAKYCCASEESLDFGGWDYANTLAQLVKNPEMPAVEIGKNLTKYTLDYYEYTHPYSRATHFLLNLDKTQNVLDALSNFSKKVTIDNDDDLLAIGIARSNTSGYYFNNPITATIDLTHFMELLKEQSNNPAIDNAAQVVIDAVKEAVLYGGALEGHPHTKGLAIYFPENKEFYTTTPAGSGVNWDPEKYFTRTVPRMNDWRQFLSNYYVKLDKYIGTGLPISLSPSLANINSAPFNSLNPAEVKLAMQGQALSNFNFSSVWQNPDTLNPVRIFSFPLAKVPTGKLEAGTNKTATSTTNLDIHFPWKARMGRLTNGKGESVIVAPIFEDNSKKYFHVFGHFFPAGQSQFEEGFLSFRYKLTGSVFDSLYISNTSKGLPGYTKAAPHQGAKFLPVFDQFLVKPEGIVFDAPIPLPDQSAITFEAQPLRFELTEAQPGNYTLFLQVANITGAKKTETIRNIFVQSKGKAMDYVGYFGMALGARFEIPVNYKTVKIESEQGEIVRYFVEDTSKMDGIILKAKSYPSGANGADEVAEFTSGLVDVSDLKTNKTTMNNQDAVLITYNNKNGLNQAYLFYDTAQTGISYILSLQVPEAQKKEAREKFTHMIESSKFF